MECMEVVKVLNNLNLLAKLPSLNRLFDLLLDEQNCVLTSETYQEINKKSRIFNHHLHDFVSANQKLDKLVTMFAYDKVNPDKAATKDISSLHNKNNPDYVHVKRLLEDFSVAFDVCAALIKPRTGICEEYMNRRLPMSHLDGRPEKIVLRYFCKKYTSCYSVILSKLSIEYNMNAQDDFIQKILEHGKEDEEDEEEDEKKANKVTRRLSQSSSISNISSLTMGDIAKKFKSEREGGSEAGENRRGSFLSELGGGKSTFGVAESVFGFGAKSFEEEEVRSDGEWSDDEYDEEEINVKSDNEEWLLADESDDETSNDNRTRSRTESINSEEDYDPILQGLLNGKFFTNKKNNNEKDKGLYKADSFADKRKKIEKKRIKDFIKMNKQTVKLYLFERCKSLLSINDLIDQYFATAISIIVCLSLSELMQIKSNYSEFMTAGAQLASDFVRNCLPLCEEILNFSSKNIKKNVMNLSLSGLKRDSFNSIFRMFVCKLRILNCLFLTFDNFVFPQTIDAHANGLKCITVCHMAANIILTGGYDRLLKIWNISTGELLGTFAGHKSIVTSCKFSNKDNFFISSSFDTTIRVWNSQTAQCKFTLSGHTDGVTSAALTADDSFIASSSTDSTVRLWNARDGKCLRIFRGHAPPTWVKSVNFSFDGKYLISSGLDKRVCVWCIRPLLSDSSKQKPVENWQAHDDYILDAVTSAPDQLITTSKDRCVRVWNLQTGALRKSISNKLPTWCSIVAVSGDGKLMLSASFDNFVLVYKTNTGTLLRQCRLHNAGILSAIFSLDSSSIFIGTIDGKLQVINL